MGKPGERITEDGNESNGDEKPKAKMTDFLVHLMILIMSSMANAKQFLQRILKFGNTLDWFLMGVSILSAIGAGTVRSSTRFIWTHVHRTHFIWE